MSLSNPLFRLWPPGFYCFRHAIDFETDEFLSGCAEAKGSPAECVLCISVFLPDSATTALSIHSTYWEPLPSSPLLSYPSHFVCTSAHDLFPCRRSVTFSPFWRHFQFCHPLKIKLPIFSLNPFPFYIPISVTVEFILLSLQPYSKSWQMFSVQGQIGNTLGVTGYVHSVTSPQLRETWVRIPSLPRTGCWIF